jgi:hypothetical protein
MHCSPVIRMCEIRKLYDSHSEGAEVSVICRLTGLAHNHAADIASLT